MDDIEFMSNIIKQTTAMDKVGVNTHVAEASSSSFSSPQELPAPNHHGVVKRTFFQKTVFLVYPNGNVSLCQGECSSWFTDSKEMWKKKEKKKAAPVKKATVKKEESY